VLYSEVVCADEHGRADFDRLHSRCFEHEAIACAFDVLRLDGDDPAVTPLRMQGKAQEGSGDSIQYVEHAEGDGGEMFKAGCKLGLEGVVSKR
jgi:bifunctional non-homologous end joining protein LigD